MKMGDKFKEDEDMMDESFDSKEGEHKLMTMEDVAHELKKDFAEEIADSNRYFCMAKIADNADANHDSHYLLEIAKDEYTHACFIYEFMKRHNMCIPEEQESCYHKLEEKMEKFF